MSNSDQNKPTSKTGVRGGGSLPRRIARRVRAMLVPQLAELQKKVAAQDKALKETKEHVKKKEKTRVELIQKVRDLQKTDALNRRFFADLVREPLLSNQSLTTMAAFHKRQPSFITGVASNMMNDPVTRNAGLQLMIKLQFVRSLPEYVVDLSDEYPADRLATDCFGEVAFGYAVNGDPRLTGLVADFVALPHADKDGGSRDRFLQDCINGLRACILANDTASLTALLDVAPEATDDMEPRYEIMRTQAVEWLARQGQSLADVVRKESTKVGLLGYGSPLKPSTNVGDYVQTIAMMGLMARALPADVQVHGGGSATFAKVQDQVTPVTDTSKAPPVDMLWIDRDDPTTTPSGDTIHLPVNGWFMHAKMPGLFGFPFAENVRPYFVGMHINQPQMLNDDSIAYLKKYAPIGARDYHTAEVLMANGVDAFFSGCPTLTLDNVFGRQPASDRSGEFYAAHRTKKTDPKGLETRIHMEPRMPIWGHDRGLETAWSYLDDYAGASKVVTPLLHSYLPCRALDTDVTFTNENAATDPRFEGLIGISEDERITLTTAMKDLVAGTMETVLSGATDAEIAADWRARTAPRVDEIRERMAAKRAETVIEDPQVSEDWCTGLEKRRIKAGEILGAPQSDGDFVDVVFCYDANFETAIYPTVRSLVSNTQSAVRLTLLTREISQDAATRLSATFPDTEFVWIDVTDLKFEGLSLLRHTTVSTMDRLFLPQLLDYTSRAVYLDVDMVILDDIADLYNWDLDGNSLGARVTIFRGWNSGFGLAAFIERQLSPEQISVFRREYLYGKPLDFKCFNAGMQVMDLERLRAERFTDRMLGIVQRYGVNDQFAVNLFAAGKFAHIDPAWNHFATQESLPDPKLVHYTGYIKPWEKEYCPKAELWRDYIRPVDGLEPLSAFDKLWFK